MLMGVRRWSPRISAPLPRILWGGLLVAFDLPVQAASFRIDLLNDVLGMLLIASGVFRLAKCDISDAYRNRMHLAKLICVLATLRKLADLPGFEKPPAVDLLWSACMLAEIAGILLFLSAMRLLFSWVARVDPAPRRPGNEVLASFAAAPPDVAPEPRAGLAAEPRRASKLQNAATVERR